MPSNEDDIKLLLECFLASEGYEDWLNKSDSGNADQIVTVILTEVNLAKYYPILISARMIVIE